MFQSLDKIVFYSFSSVLLENFLKKNLIQQILKKVLAFMLRNRAGILPRSFTIRDFSEEPKKRSACDTCAFINLQKQSSGGRLV